MTHQCADTILMIRPEAFGSNPDTLATNAFQAEAAADPSTDRAEAVREFDGFVSAVRRAGVEVVVVEDTPEPAKPDAVFPNNWFSTHDDGQLILYPMLSRARRRERRARAIAQALERAGRRVDEVNTGLVESFEPSGRYLEGTGSVVFDRANRIAYACRSPRTDEGALGALCELLGCEPVVFDATDASGAAYYHTNVVLSVGRDFAVACLEAITEPGRGTVVRRLEATGHDVIAITREQAAGFAANVLEVRSTRGERVLILSDAAKRALGEEARRLESTGLVLAHAPIPTIERLGGGSARCMAAEVFLPRA